MKKNKIINKQLNRRDIVATLARLGVCALMLSGLNFAGCGGVSAIALFQTADQFASVGSRQVNIGRTYVKIANNIPTEIGWEFPASMLADLPDSHFGEPAIYYLPLPNEIVNSPFKVLVFSDWAAGHPPVEVGAAPHIHPIFLMSQVQQPSENLAVERTHIVDPEEIPEGFEPGDVIAATGGASNANAFAPGIGMGYEERSSAQLHPGWTTTAQNWWAYNGHLNGIGMGQVYSFLANKGSETLEMKQPRVYPQPGWYPTKQVTRYNAATNTYFISLTEFVKATRWVH